jgi:carboxymethylenebutenolidase
MRGMGRRLAGAGYAALVVNPYYRFARAPVLDTKGFDFSNPADRAKLTPLMASINADGAAERDAAAFVLWLDRQPQVDTARKIGTQGYCMGGALALRTAAAVPHRIGAVASFHGGGLVTEQPNSPHRLLSKMRAEVYLAVAANDDQRQPEAKDTLRDALAAAGRPGEVEVYASLHGWCVPDMPALGGQPIYNPPDAERAWTRLLQLYGSALA